MSKKPFVPPTFEIPDAASVGKWIALFGFSSTGKTYSALKLFSYMGLESVGVLDTNGGKSNLYADVPDFQRDGKPIFRVTRLTRHHPGYLTDTINWMVESKDFDGILIDDLSASWDGDQGALELAEEADGEKGGALLSKAGWRKINPLLHVMTETFHDLKIPFITNIKLKINMTKTVDKNGKDDYTRDGVVGVHKWNIMYEPDLSIQMGMIPEPGNSLYFQSGKYKNDQVPGRALVVKSRYPALPTNYKTEQIGAKEATLLKAWYNL